MVLINPDLPSPITPPVPPTSQQVYDGVSQTEGDRLCAGDPSAPTGHVLCRDTEQATGLPRQDVLAVTQEREAAAIEGHIVGIPRGHAHAGTSWLAAMPAALLTHTAAENEEQLRRLHAAVMWCIESTAHVTMCCSLWWWCRCCSRVDRYGDTGTRPAGHSDQPAGNQRHHVMYRSQNSI